MAKFIYRMQNILNLNEKLEEQAKMEYATQQMALNAEEEKDQRLRDRKAAYEDEARRIREDSVNVKEMMLNANAISIMGELIKVRQEHGISQKRLEELSGVKQPVIARMEKGTTNPQLDTLLKVLAPLGKTLAIVPLNNSTENRA